MRKISVKIVGLSPLRHNKFIEPNIDGDKSKSSSKMTNEDRKKDAQERTYWDEIVGYYLPAHAIKACMRDAGASVKLQGKATMKAMVKAVMIIEDNINPITAKETKIMSDAVRIPPKTGARIMQYWTVHPQWECSFVVIVLDDSIQINKIKECLEIGGMYKGLLDGRPELGRFTVEEFKLVKQ